MEKDRHPTRCGDINEMVIVDTFTRLIFGQRDPADDTENAIIDTLTVLHGDYGVEDRDALGRWLSAMEVREMIEVVGLVRDRLHG